MSSCQSYCSSCFSIIGPEVVVRSINRYCHILTSNRIQRVVQNTCYVLDRYTSSWQVNKVILKHCIKSFGKRVKTALSYFVSWKENPYFLVFPCLTKDRSIDYHIRCTLSNRHTTVWCNMWGNSFGWPWFLLCWSAVFDLQAKYN